MHARTHARTHARMHSRTHAGSECRFRHEEETTADDADSTVGRIKSDATVLYGLTSKPYEKGDEVEACYKETSKWKTAHIVETYGRHGPCRHRPCRHRPCRHRPCRHRPCPADMCPTSCKRRSSAIRHIITVMRAWP